MEVTALNQITPNQISHHIKQILNDVEVVDISIASFLQQRMGKLWTNDLQQPSSFMLENGIFRIFAGRVDKDFFLEAQSNFPNQVVILPSSHGWFDYIQSTFSEQIEIIERHKMDSNSLALERLKSNTQELAELKVTKIDLSLARQIANNTNFSYHLQNFKSPEDFIARGQGYVALDLSSVVGVASSALVCDEGVEINIMVLPSHRNKGIALSLSQHLVSDVLMSGKRPNWDAGNLESLGLAKKLGYKHDKTYQAIRFKRAIDELQSK